MNLACTVSDADFCDSDMTVRYESVFEISQVSDMYITCIGYVIIIVRVLLVHAYVVCECRSRSMHL